MAQERTSLNAEKLTQLIRKIFQEEFKKQEVHITNIISSNFKITMEEIKKSQEQIKELKKEVTDLKCSVEHTDADLNDLSDRVDEIYDYQVDPESVTNKLIDLENRSRRNKLRIDGISESRNGRNVKRKYKKYLMKSLVLKMFKLKGHIAQRGAKVTTIVENQEQ